ncbi:MAG: 1-acyl-sn-glycerol-3-phosphate acyltransferase [Bacteroidales bacterium]|nr:1-acyl-sn-glycerol-3-phosphate acyltransferase [Bacteroidales bacterium]
MGIEKIEKFSIRYLLLKTFGKFWHDYIFYRKVEYVNRKSVPWNEHIIITPNHQNALMDALAVELSKKNQFVFVARSDIFKKKFIARMLYFLKILPVYRIRDGFETLKKNEQTFKKTLDIINNKNGFVIMPEGNHAGYRRLRPLRKGFARIAFQAEEATNFSLDIKLIPVGISYSNYEKYRSDLLVVFGEPVPVSRFYDEYKANPAVAFNKIKDELAKEIKPLMIDIESEENYDVYDSLRYLYEKRAAKKLEINTRRRLYNQFKVHKTIISALDTEEKAQSNEFNILSAKTKAFLKNMQQMKLNTQVFEKKSGNMILWLVKSLLLIVGFPFFAYGFINNGIPYFAPFLITRLFKDRQFHSSFKFGVSFFLFTPFYVLQTVLIYLLSENGQWTFYYIISLPLSAVIAWKYSRLYLSTQTDFRVIQNKKSKRFKESKKLYSEIMNLTNQVFQKNQEKK